MQLNFGVVIGSISFTAFAVNNEISLLTHIGMSGWKIYHGGDASLFVTTSEVVMVSTFPAQSTGKLAALSVITALVASKIVIEYRILIGKRVMNYYTRLSWDSTQ